MLYKLNIQHSELGCGTKQEIRKDQTFSLSQESSLNWGEELLKNDCTHTPPTYYWRELVRSHGMYEVSLKPTKEFRLQP